MERNKKIIKISIQGIIVNVLLVIFKSIIGIISNSISIVLDALNNLTDVLSASITIIGTKLSSKKPDKEHPYGHGRIEYFTSIIIAIIVLVAGLGALNESVTKIINAETATYAIPSLVIIFITIFVKLFFGRYVKGKGKELKSDSLVATGVDAIGDAVVTSTTFIGAIISYFFNISIEGYIGVIISLLIIKTAMSIIKTSVNNMIGVRADVELTRRIKELVNTHDGVLGAYDLTLHNYGPSNIIGTVNIEVKDDMTAKEIHRITRNIIIDVYKTLGIFLTIGIYASNDSKHKDIKKYVMNIIKEYPQVLELHAFYVEEERQIISFDLVFDFEEKDPEKIRKEIIKKIKQKYPKYDYVVIIDKDYSD